MGKYRKSLFIVLVISLFLLVDNVSAESIQNTCYSINQACSTKNRFTYSLYGSTDDFYTGSFGSRYNGKADYLVFEFDYSLLGKSTYMISISASDIDFRNIKQSNTFVYSLVGSKPTNDCQTMGDPIQVTNVSFSQSKVVITIKTESISSGFAVIFGSDGASTYVTGINSFGFTTVDITTVESNDTQNIIDNANQNSQAIIDNNKENTESIIDNQNQNTQDIIDSNKVCSSYDKTSIIDDNGFLYSNGVKVSSENYGITDYINVNNATISTLVEYGTSTTAYSCFYNVNKTLISCFNNQNTGEIIVPNDAHYVRFSIQKVLNKPQFKVCKNGGQSVSDGLNDLTGAITDSSPPDTNGLADAPGWLPAGPVDSIVTLPINLLQSLTNNLESACTPINLPIPFIDDNLTLDCPSTLLRRIDGFWLFWEGFGLIAGVWCLYKYFINLYKWVESHLSMDEKESLGKWGGV